MASGISSAVPGGEFNSAEGLSSFAAGHRAKALHDGSFVWSDDVGFDFPVAGQAQANNSFFARATGGFLFVTAVNGVSGLPASSAYLAPGSGSWADLSDRDAKENIQQVDAGRVLEQLVRIPVSTWNYKSQEEKIRHIGPMAQDFHSAFGVGEEERYISTVDAQGVALAAIQGLYRVVEEEKRTIQELRAELDAVKETVAGLTARQEVAGNP